MSDTDPVRTAYAEAIKGRVLNADAVLSFDPSQFEKNGAVDAVAVKTWVTAHSSEIAPPPSSKAGDVRARILDRRAKHEGRVAALKAGTPEPSGRLVDGKEAYQRRHPEKPGAASTEPVGAYSPPAKGTSAAGASEYARRHGSRE